MAFFGIAALVALLIALGLFIPVFIEYYQTGLVLRFPTLIVSVTFWHHLFAIFFGRRYPRMWW